MKHKTRRLQTLNSFLERKSSIAELEINPDGAGLTTICVINRDEVPLSLGICVMITTSREEK